MFCQLDGAERAILEVFLRSRGNVKEVQSFLGVSYPTARQRVADLLGQLGFADQVPDRSEATTGLYADADRPVTSATGTTAQESERVAPDPADVLAQVAAGLITVTQAEALLTEVYRRI